MTDTRQTEHEQDQSRVDAMGDGHDSPTAPTVKLTADEQRIISARANARQELWSLCGVSLEDGQAQKKEEQKDA